MTRIPDLERQLVAAARRTERSAARRWRGLPLLALVAGLLTAGVGTAAVAGLLDQGAPVPSALESGNLPDRPGDAEVLPLRVPDPAGGPAWGISVQRLVDGKRVITCASPARVQNGRAGVIGRDGVFHDDGRFHPLAPGASASGSCTGGKRIGWFVLSPMRVPTSGYSGTVGDPRVGGCRENAPRRTVTRRERRRLRHVPVCGPDAMRRVTLGAAGPAGRTVTYRDRHMRRTIRLNRSDSGAYLFVSRVGGGSPDVTVTYEDGTRCPGIPPRDLAVPPECFPPPGVPRADPGRDAVGPTPAP
jgi:hypothetical protein